MRHDATTFYEPWPAAMNQAKAANPDIGRAFGPFFQALMNDSALPVKVKELIAVAVMMGGGPRTPTHRS